jgi:hypothetical protein
MVNEHGTPINIKDKSEIEKWLLARYGFYEDKLQRDGTMKPTFVGCKVEIASDGTIQQFTKTGLSASTKRTRDKNHNEMYGNLSEIIQNAIFSHDENADNRHSGLKGQKIYYSAVRLWGKTFAVRIKLDVSKHDLIKPAFKDLKIEKEITT